MRFAPINQGLFLLQQPLLSNDQHRCIIDFTFSVNRLGPHHRYPPPPSDSAVADFNGNGSTDIGVWRPSSGQWFVNDQFVRSWGWTGDIPVAGTTTATAPPTSPCGGPRAASGSYAGQPAASWGLTGDIPVPADYDGNGTADRAVFRGGAWFYHVTGSVVSYGLSGDAPTPLPPALYMRLVNQG